MYRDTGNQIWIYVINLPVLSGLPGFKAPFHGDGQSALNPGTTVFLDFDLFSTNLLVSTREDVTT